MGLIRAVYCRKGKDESGSARKPEIEFSNAAPSPMSCFFRWEACSSTFTRTECSLDMPRRRLYICMPCRVNQVFLFSFLPVDSFIWAHRVPLARVAYTTGPFLVRAGHAKELEILRLHPLWGLRKALPFLRVINTWRKSQDARIYLLACW